MEMARKYRVLATVMAAGLGTAAYAAADSVAADVAAAAPPSELTNASIAEHNAALAPADPAFIKCRRIAMPGSLVRKARVCKSNADWKKSWDAGNQNARDTYEAMNKGSSNSIEPVDEFSGPRARPN